MKQLIILTVCLFTLSGIAYADNDKPISVNELPQKARNFIQTFFSKHTVSYAKMEKDFLEKSYDVAFTNGEKIEFDKNGEWKEVSCKLTIVPDAVVPKQIKSYLTEQFPQAKILKIERDAKGYEVELNNKLDIKFNTQFQVVEIDD